MWPRESREFHGTSAFQTGNAVAGRCADQNASATDAVLTAQTLPFAYEFGS
jgi:hypothetical protein